MHIEHNRAVALTLLAVLNGVSNSLKEVIWKRRWWP